MSSAALINSGAYRPGQSGNPAGKPKGAISKFNRSIKDMVERALHQAGGVDYLARQAEQNPVAFMGLVGRVLPLQISGGDAQSSIALHLLAAQVVSQQLQTQLSGQTPPTIDGEAKRLHLQPDASPLDTPVPTE